MQSDDCDWLMKAKAKAKTQNTNEQWMLDACLINDYYGMFPATMTGRAKQSNNDSVF